MFCMGITSAQNGGFRYLPETDDVSTSCMPGQVIHLLFRSRSKYNLPSLPHSRALSVYRFQYGLFRQSSLLKGFATSQRSPFQR